MKKAMLLKTIFLVLVVVFIGCKKEDPDSITGSEFSNSSGKGSNVSAVFTQTNSAAGNEVLMYTRSGNGGLSFTGSFPTGGMGSGAGLGSQGAVILYEDLLFAVNAGSNEVSVFSVSNSGLTLVDKEASGGVGPISVTAHNNLLYVLNGGGTGNISGFMIANDGTISPIAGSTKPLSSPASGPAQIQFTPDGNVIVVTEKATNMILTYNVDGSGVANGPTAQPSAGNTPFGFEFDMSGHLIVSEAFGGGAGLGAMSSYNVNGGVSLISGPVANSQTAPCWVVVTKNGKFTYTSNTGSHNISGYDIQNDGSITLFNDGGNTASTGAGSAPIDMAISHNSQYLYALNSGNQTMHAFRINNGSGKLTCFQIVSNIPMGSVGLAAN